MSLEDKSFKNRIDDKPLPCPCCGSKDLRLENLVLEGVVSCRDCKLTMIRKHTPCFRPQGLGVQDDGLQRAIFAWNCRFDFERG
jgi:hypothetical protein